MISSVAAHNGCGKASAIQATCSSLPPPVVKATQDYRLAYAQVGSEDANPFRLAETFLLSDHAARLGLNLTVFNADNSAYRQGLQLNSMVEAGYDAIFLSPVDETTVSPQIVAARKACIPVFLVDRDVDHSLAIPGRDYVTYVGVDPVQQGNAVGNWLLSHVQGPLTVLELLGTAAASTTAGLQNGFDTVVAEQMRVAIVGEVAGNFSRSRAYSDVKTFLGQNASVNVVFAHSDDMGLGALDVLSQSEGLLGSLKPGDGIYLLSVGGTLEAIQGIKSGLYSATMTDDPNVAVQAVNAWLSYIDSEAVPTWIQQGSTIIDAQNASAALPNGY